jgi:hypothetical protein
MRLSFIFPSFAPWKIISNSFQSSQHTADVVLLKLCNDFVPPITQIHKFPEVTKGSEHDFICYKVSLKATYMCMTCRVGVLHTNRKRFLHLREGEIDKYLKKILSKFGRYCSLYHCQLNIDSYIISDRAINTVCLLSLYVKTS